MPSRLLIISCSKRKNQTSVSVPACDLYDGSVFRTIKKWKNQNTGGNIEILIISAKYGSISWGEPVSYYDTRMTKSIAEQLKPKIYNSLISLKGKSFSEIYIELGRNYITAIPDMSKIFPSACIFYGQGKMGYRLHNLKVWLNKK